MYNILTVIFLITSIFVRDDFNKFISLLVVAGLFAIAGNLWGIEEAITESKKEEKIEK